MSDIFTPALNLIGDTVCLAPEGLGVGSPEEVVGYGPLPLVAQCSIGGFVGMLPQNFFKL